jgi:EmrB/QacA subfamily drug resistance transporter
MRPGIVMAITVAAISLTGIGLSSISVVYPELIKAFPEASPATLSWVANAFTIVGAATLIPAGALADRTGKKRMVLIGVALYLVGSFVGAVAPNAGWIIAGRTVQALGSSAYTPATAALLMSAFPPERLAAAIGVWSITGGITAAAGPPIAGLLINLGDWRWTFWFNLPFGVLVLVLSHRYLVEGERDRSRAIPDPLGAILVTAAVSPVVYALVQSTRWGWLDARTAGCLVAGVAIMGLFLLRCTRHPNPLVDLRLFRLRTLRIANLGAFVMSITWFCAYWAMVTFASRTWGWSALRIGGTTAPVSLMAGVAGIVAGRIAVRTGHRVFILPGTIAFALTTIWLWTVIDATPSNLEIIVGSALLGTASGCAFPSFIAASMVDVPVAQHAVGSGVNFMSQRIGTTVGVALAITFLTNPGGLDGLHRCFVVTIVGTVLAFLIGLRIDTRPAN